MKTSIVFLATIAMNASAFPYPDVVCKPHLMADAGYEVSLVKSANGYLGHLDALKIYGAEPMFRGPVKLEAYIEDQTCKLLITNPVVKCGTDRCVGPNSFKLQMQENQATKLLSVGGKLLSDPGSTMDCRYSPEFLADFKALCADN